jgi:hypothetical protein
MPLSVICITQRGSGARRAGTVIQITFSSASRRLGFAAHSVYSHGSGDTYYGRIVMQGSNSLRVEACALGRFYCSANVWSRIGAPSTRLISSRQVASEPRS